MKPLSSNFSTSGPSSFYSDPKAKIKLLNCGHIVTELVAKFIFRKKYGNPKPLCTICTKPVSGSYPIDDEIIALVKPNLSKEKSSSSSRSSKRSREDDFKEKRREGEKSKKAKDNSLPKEQREPSPPASSSSSDSRKKQDIDKESPLQKKKLLEGFNYVTKPNGEVYGGEFQNGKYHGIGRITYPDGTSLHGLFENGKFIEEIDEE